MPALRKPDVEIIEPIMFSETADDADRCGRNFQGTDDHRLRRDDASSSTCRSRRDDQHLRLIHFGARIAAMA